MKAQGKSSSVVGRGRLTDNAAAGSQILNWQDQQALFQQRNSNTEATASQRQPNHFSSNPLKLHPQHQS